MGLFTLAFAFCDWMRYFLAILVSSRFPLGIGILPTRPPCPINEYQNDLANLKSTHKIFEEKETRAERDTLNELGASCKISSHFFHVFFHVLEGRILDHERLELMDVV